MDSFIFFGKRGFGTNNSFIENVCSTLCSNSISEGFVPFLQTKLFKMKLIRIMQVLLLSCFALLCKIAKIFFRCSKMYKGGKQHIQSKKRKICNNSQCSNTLLAQLTSIFGLSIQKQYSEGKIPWNKKYQSWRRFLERIAIEYTTILYHNSIKELEVEIILT